MPIWKAPYPEGKDMGGKEKGHKGCIAWLTTQQGQIQDKPGERVLEIKSRKWRRGVRDLYVTQEGVSRGLRRKLCGQSKRISDQNH